MKKQLSLLFACLLFFAGCVSAAPQTRMEYEEQTIGGFSFLAPKDWTKKEKNGELHFFSPHFSQKDGKYLSVSCEAYPDTALLEKSTALAYEQYAQSVLSKFENAQKLFYDRIQIDGIYGRMLGLHAEFQKEPLTLYAVFFIHRGQLFSLRYFEMGENPDIKKLKDTTLFLSQKIKDTEKSGETKSSSFSYDALKSDLPTYSHFELFETVRMALDALQRKEGISPKDKNQLLARLEYVILSMQKTHDIHLSRVELKEIYKPFDYDAYLKQSDENTGKKYRIQGRILQIVPTSGRTEAQLRVATKNEKEDVVYIVIRPAPAMTFDEHEDVVFYCSADGIHSYESTEGRQIMLPLLFVDEGTPIEK